MNEVGLQSSLREHAMHEFSRNEIRELTRPLVIFLIDVLPDGTSIEMKLKWYLARFHGPRFFVHAPGVMTIIGQLSTNPRWAMRGL